VIAFEIEGIRVRFVVLLVMFGCLVLTSYDYNVYYLKWHVPVRYKTGLQVQ
jgi:hypothetical protein